MSMDKSNLVIEACALNDVSAVKNLHEQNYDKAWSRYFFKKMVTEPQYELYVIRSDHKIMGFVAFQGTQGQYELIMIIIDKSYRNIGIGSYLLSETIKQLRINGVNLITLDVSTENSIAKKLYTKQGFIKFGERLGYYNYNNKKISSESYRLVNF